MTFDWDTAEPHERDSWIAEHVMGWVRYYGRDDAAEPSERTPYCLLGSPEYVAEWSKKFGASEEPNGEEAIASSLPHFTTDAAADFMVLERVREWGGSEWGGEDDTRFQSFCNALPTIWWPRSTVSLHFNLATLYEPGDWSHAAYLALQETER